MFPFSGPVLNTLVPWALCFQKNDRHHGRLCSVTSGFGDRLTQEGYHGAGVFSCRRANRGHTRESENKPT